MSWSRRILVALLGLMLMGCSAGLKPLVRSPEAAPPQGVRIPSPLTGEVDWGPVRQVQGTTAEIANRATVGLIAVTTGYTMASSTTDANGRFSMVWANGIEPPDGLYYIEAYKGLMAGTTVPNRVNSDVARVRTLIRRQSGVWYSLTGSALRISPTTTALCIILSMRSQQSNPALVIDQPELLLGTVDGNPGTATSPARWNNPMPAKIDSTFMVATYQAVYAALAADSDPFKSMSVDEANPNVILIPPKPLTVAAYVPAAQLTGGAVNIIGSGFSATASENVVEFTNVAGLPVPATVASVSVDSASMSVTVPAGAVTGAIGVTVNGRKIVGPTFYLALQSGHESIDSFGNLYVANEGFGTIAKITPLGAVSTFATGLTSPRALTINNGTNKMYVTCAGTKKGVVVYDFANAGAGFVNYGAVGGIADPRGIAYDSAGVLYIADGANNKIYRLDSAVGSPTALTITVTNGASLSNPHGLGFGADGKLYVANTNANNVITLAVSGLNATTDMFKQGFASPWGLAFDPLGNLYISNNKGNSVSRWDKTLDTVIPYATMPSPGGLVADRLGYVYGIDNTANNIYRVTSVGDSGIFASGISSPAGVCQVGQFIYVLSQGNNSLMEIDTVTTAVRTVARGFNRPVSLEWDAARQCFYVNNYGTSTLLKVSSPSFSVATLMTGLSYGGGSFQYRNNQLVMPVSGATRVYDVTNLASYTDYRTAAYYFSGLDKDVSGGAFNGAYYLAEMDNNRVVRIMGGGGCNGGTTAGQYLEEFLRRSEDNDIQQPRGVAVDNSGKVWITNYASDKVVVYNADRTKASFSPLNAGPDPLHARFDGTTMWIVSRGTDNNIKGYNPTTGALVATLTVGGHAPRFIGFKGTDMYVACDQGVGRITSYATAPSYSLLTDVVTNGWGIAVYSNGDIFVGSGGAIYRIPADLSMAIQYETNYNTIRDIFKVPGSDTFYYTDDYRFNSRSCGSYSTMFTGAIQGPHGPRFAGIDSNGNFFGNGNIQCGLDAVSRIASSSVPGAFQKEWFHNVNSYGCSLQSNGGVAADNLGNWYWAGFDGMYVRRYSPTGAVDTAANSLGSLYNTWGLWAEPAGAYLLQTSLTHHRVDKITFGTPGTGNGTRTTLPYGLSSAEM